MISQFSTEDASFSLFVQGQNEDGGTRCSCTKDSLKAVSRNGKKIAVTTCPMGQHAPLCLNDSGFAKRFAAIYSTVISAAKTYIGQNSLLVSNFYLRFENYSFPQNNQLNCYLLLFCFFKTFSDILIIRVLIFLTKIHLQVANWRTSFAFKNKKIYSHNLIQ